MKLFKTLKRKVGNALLPVVGTILGLTILAGSVVAVALNSSKIVYRQNNLQKQNEARNILYIAAKYFSEGLTNGVDANTLKDELYDAFDLLVITRVSATSYKLYYPDSFSTSGNAHPRYPKDESKKVDKWLFILVDAKEVDAGDGGDHGQTGMNNTLFSEEAKIDEKYNIGNMATLYMMESGWLPIRWYPSNVISKVSSDIDTFDEAIAYEKGNATLLVDRLGVALFYYDAGNGRYYVHKDSNGVYSVSKDRQTENGNLIYQDIYNTGMLGGNYYWQMTDNDGNITTTKARVYKQEYDLDLLVNVLEQEKYKAEYDIVDDTLDYSYNELQDKHTFTFSYIDLSEDSSETKTETAYLNSEQLARFISEYIYGIYKLNPMKLEFVKNNKNNATLIQKIKDKSYQKVLGTLGAKEKIGEQFYVWPFDFRDDYPTTYNISFDEDNGKYGVKVNYYTSTLKLSWNFFPHTNTRNYYYSYLDLYDILINECGLTPPSPTYSTDQIKEAFEYSYASGQTITNLTFSDRYIFKYKIVHSQYYSEDATKTLTKAEYNDMLKNYTNPTDEQIKAAFKAKYYKNNTLSDITYSQAYQVTYKINHGTWQEDKSMTMTISEYNSMLRKYDDKVIIDTLDYLYTPTTTIQDIIGGGMNDVGDDATLAGYREQALVYSMAQYLADNDPDVKALLKNNTVTSMNLRECKLYTENDNDTGYGSSKYVLKYQFQLRINYKDANGNNKEKILNPTFYFKLLSYTPLVYDRNGDGTFDSNGAVLTQETQNINGVNKQAIMVKPAFLYDTLQLDTLLKCQCPITVINKIGRDFNSLNYNEVTGYRTHRISNDMGDYRDVLNDTTLGTNLTIKKNTYCGHSLTVDGGGGTPLKLTIEEGNTLYIDGNLYLTNNVLLKMEPGSMLFVNGSMNVDYSYAFAGIPTIFNSNGDAAGKGVYIDCTGANIIINGDFNYSGQKYNEVGSVTIQQGFNANCRNKNHPTDYRCYIKGNFMVNGDVNFIAKYNSGWTGDANKTVNEGSFIGVVGVAYSNPLVNATFYVDGIFNMKGLWTSGLYDMCRPNFVFSRSIIQPDIAWGTVFNGGLIGLLSGEFCKTYGYLFMICEDAINFSDCNFAAINIFTPYQMLTSALEENKLNEFDFTQFISKEQIDVAYTEAEIDLWGLPSILRSGMIQVFAPGDPGNIGETDAIQETDIM